MSGAVRIGIVISGAMHMAAIVITAYGLPQVWDPVNGTAPPMLVELVDIAEVTNLDDLPPAQDAKTRDAEAVADKQPSKFMREAPVPDAKAIRQPDAAPKAPAPDTAPRPVQLAALDPPKSVRAREPAPPPPLRDSGPANQLRIEDSKPATLRDAKVVPVRELDAKPKTPEPSAPPKPPDPPDKAKSAETRTVVPAPPVRPEPAQDQAARPEPADAKPRQPEPSPVRPARPVPTVEDVPKPPSKPKRFDINRIAALLDKSAREPTPPPSDSESTQARPRRPVRAMSPGPRLSDAPLTISETDAIMAQIQGCWSIPAGALDAENLVVRVRVFLNPNGSLAKAPEIVDRLALDRPGREYLRVAAESARRAVEKCAPLKNLPLAKYERWREMILIFDPKEVLGG